MNKEAISYLATALISAGVGAAIAWYVAKAKYETEVQQQVYEVKNYYAQIKTEDIRDEQVEEEEVAEEEVFPDSPQYTRHLEVYGSESVTVKDPDDRPATPYHKAYPSSENPTIFVIPKDEFYNRDDDREKETLVWYAGDEVMLDFYGNVLTDHVDVVGNEFDDTFVQDGQTRNTWVRNVKTEVDYEIELHEGLYTEEVLGFFAEDHPPLKFRDED